MKAVVGLAAMALFVMAACPAVAQQNERYAAIAYSPATGKIGIGNDNVSRDEAEQVAMSNCQAEVGSSSDCTPAAWARNGCVAIAVAENKAWGANYGANQEQAKTNAIAMCGKYAVANAASCRVTRSFCVSGIGRGN